MRLALTADLHWGHTSAGDAATRDLVRALDELRPHALVIAGDVGTGPHFAACLRQFSGLTGPRMALPGNHDLWTTQPAPASLDLWDRDLPRIAREHGFHYLDREPYVGPDGTEAVVGSINWYDYSFADPRVEAVYPRAREMYAAKLFPNARHNDGRFVRLGMSDEEFTGRVVERFRSQLAQLPASVRRVAVVQHHPPIRELFFPGGADDGPIERRFWLAYTGNRRMQDAVFADPRVTAIVCGHTHRAIDLTVGGRRCLNLGGDYGWKRLVLLDTESLAVEAWEFGRG